MDQPPQRAVSQAQDIEEDKPSLIQNQTKSICSKTSLRTSDLSLPAAPPVLSTVLALQSSLHTLDLK